MNRLFKKSAQLMALILLLSPLTSKANLELISPEDYEKGRQQVARSYADRNMATLREVLSSSHLFVQAQAALALGRLGDQQSLDTLKKLDAQYNLFPCAPTGEFGVAVILIENYAQGPEAQKRALLEKAVKDDSFVSDAAARELVRFDDLSVVGPLSKIDGYGAQYTTLRLKRNRLPLEDTIDLCVRMLEEHRTPMTAQAAQEVLVECGPIVATSVKNLFQRVKTGVSPSAPRFRGAIMSRCEHILNRVAVKGPTG